MSDPIDYGAIDIPAEKDPTEYTYVERRSEILSLVKEAGHPRAIKQTELAKRYDTSQSNISKDFDRLRDHIQKQAGDDAQFISQLVYQRAIRDLLDEDPYKAARVVSMWNDWLFDSGTVERSPDRVDLSGGLELDNSHGLDEDDRELALDMIRERQRQASGGDDTDE